MTSIDTTAAALAHRIMGQSSARTLVCLAGAPASGKSTLADALAACLNTSGCQAAVVGMDGFHLDNRILDARGLRARKGAPETFDAPGFIRLIQALKTREEVFVPIFDRDRDLAIAGADVVPAGAAVVIVEGNYLMFDEPPWALLAPMWDLSVRINLPLPILRDRLIARWLGQGHCKHDATRRAENNDIANAIRIMQRALPCDLDIDT